MKSSDTLRLGRVNRLKVLKQVDFGFYPSAEFAFLDDLGQIAQKSAPAAYSLQGNFFAVYKTAGANL